jgi:hypothetical protein
MDSVLQKFVSKLILPYDKRIVDLLDSQQIEYLINNPQDTYTICCQTKDFVTNILLNGNIDVFSKLIDPIAEKAHVHTVNEDHYFRLFWRLIFCFGNLEMIEFFHGKYNLLKVPYDHFEYVAYRLDDNAEIVEAVLSKIRGYTFPLFDNLASEAIYSNNIKIFKYIYDYTLVDGESHIRFLYSIKRCFIWTSPCIEFLEFFLSKSLLSEDDIINVIDYDNILDKVEVVLSYVESGHLKLSSKTVGLLNEAINKNGP